jgi:cytoskeleton protein RodZ
MDASKNARDPDADQERESSLFRAKPDGELDPAGEAGWFLQREREKRGETVEAAGEASGVHPFHVQAIEAGDLTRLPPRLEALEMVASYAQYLGFEPEPLVKHYSEFLPRPRVAPASHPANPSPLSSAKIIKFGGFSRPKFTINGLPGGPGTIVASCLGAVLLFGAVSWYSHTSSQEPQVAEIVQPATDIPTASTGDRAADVKVSESAMPDDQPATVMPGGKNTVGVAPLSEEDAAGAGLNGLTAFIEQTMGDVTTEALPSEKPLGQIASADESVQTPDGRQFGSPSDASRLVLRAKAPVWVRIEDAQGSVVMTQMLMKGDSYRVPNRPGLVVIARDGGLLSYEIDGKPHGLLGSPGEILVGRPLDIKSLDKG